jgi:genome maintenance exonuclease 1
MLVHKFPYQKLTRKTLDGERLYTCPDGNQVASVTTILSATKPEKDKQALNNWKKRVGKDNAAKITRNSSSRGTRMHSFLENYVKDNSMGDAGTNPFSVESYNMASHVIAESLNKTVEFYGTEVSLYYPELWAGTTDVVANYQGELTIVDFKQSDKPKKTEWVEDYKMQLAGYIISHDKVYETNIKQGIIMMCTPKLEFQQWVISGKVLEEYKEKWWDRVYQYYEKRLNKDTNEK